MPRQPLYSFAQNVTSQFGEDGVLAEILRRIGVRSRTCVEFGAWDGKHFSNTWDLWHNQGWAAILIEGNAKRFATLRENVARFSAVIPINAYVTATGENSLDGILSRCGTPLTPDVMSIDIDGDEYYVWKEVTKFRPRVLIIEYNPTIPPDVDLVQLPGEYFGASARALVRLAQGKNYGLACCTETNCIFVARPDYGALGMPEPELEDIFPRGNLTYVVNAYDGRMYITRNPTYSPAIPMLGASVLQRELRSNLFPPRNAKTSDLPTPPGALTAVKIFALSTAPPRNLVRRLYERLRCSIVPSQFKAWSQRHWVLAAWRAAGRPSPPPHEMKQKILLRYAARHHLRVLVETGAYLGDMIAAVHRKFERVVSIELDAELHRRASERFSHLQHVQILLGDSGEVLPEILAGIDSPALFWLDGHYSAGVTAKGGRETPILQELEHILSHPVDRHVILIDDARCFNGTHDYPTLAQLEEFVRAHRPRSRIKIEADIIRIT